MLTSFLQQSATTNGTARDFALENTVELKNLIPPTVSYESRGNLLIVGDLQEVEAVFSHFDTMNSVTALIVGAETQTSTIIPSTQCFFSQQVTISGFLGHFDVGIIRSGVSHNLARAVTGEDHFDVVLDLTSDGIMQEEVPVPGYYPSGRGYPTLDESLEAIPDLIGTFDKPKFFRLNTQLCAHSSRGVKGCTRCIDACPAGALTSQGSEKTGHKIEINPYLCQGVGTCATSCPTEAISYALPEPTETQTFIERVLAKYFAEGGETPIVMFCSSRHEKYNLMMLGMLPDNVIPITLDELPSVGIDTWFSALIHGACQVMFAASRHMPATIIRVLESEVDIAQTLLAQLGLEKQRIDILYMEDLRHSTPALIQQPLAITTSNIQSGMKRDRLFNALDLLAEHYTPDANLVTNNIAPVPSGAPFGSVNCYSDNCTLCMSCVSVCPTRALHAKGDSPALLFTEQDCVQCGLCESACPEKVISLEPRFNWDKQQRTQDITLHQEPAAHCLSCGKPFAPASMIEMLQDKLRGHSHFANEEKLRRIAMCEDCRVRDLFSDLTANPAKQLDI
ncbi:4Fe-4S dicluster domain-containing protein [Vibrio litoralis]|uniref:4Fe-4S dicluster domain-containing protein n=1 Tax=Vibrio litoralis TaxID=335972 RepID=UPI00040AE435|nr:4Fe-4S dicluster domain-containing protein [Vibrio litoralis]